MLSVWPSISLILFFFLFFLQLCDYNSPYTDCSLTPSAYLLDQWTLSLIFKSDCFTKFVRLIQFSHGFFATHFSLFRFFFLLVAFLYCAYFFYYYLYLNDVSSPQISYLQEDCGRKKQGWILDHCFLPHQGNASYKDGISVWFLICSCFLASSCCQTIQGSSHGLPMHPDPTINRRSISPCSAGCVWDSISILF